MTSYWGHYISSKHIDLYGSVWKYIGQTAKLQFNVEHDQMLGTPFSLSLVKSISYHPWWIDSHLVTLIGEGNFSSNTYMYMYIHIYHLLKLFGGWPMVIPHASTLIQSTTAHQLSSIQGSGWWFQPSEKIWKSVGIVIPNIWEKMFQTTNQILSYTTAICCLL